MESNDKEFPVVCMDESPKQLVEAVREEPMRSGCEKRAGYEYIRHGVANVFMASEPLNGKRFAEVTPSKTKRDRALFMKHISDDIYADAKKITLVMDNLSTHSMGAFYEAFSPEEAKRLVNRFDFVYTPKHGSWLNMAEIELRILNSQCLKRHIAAMGKVKSEVKAWQEHRNKAASKINWQFTNEMARVKLKRLYPTYLE